MKISVLVIAHNEELHIARCIESVLAQTTKADEVVLISHNSTDKTSALARAYPVRVIDYKGPVGPAYARIRGLEEVTGDLVLCIDGDATAAPTWIETLSKLLMKPGMVMVGSWVRMSGTLYAVIASWRWYFFCATQGPEATSWLWGASFGLWTRDRDTAINALVQGMDLSKKLELPYNPDDYWLALFMSKHGGLEVTNKTSVNAYAKERTSFEGISRGFMTYFSLLKKIRPYVREHFGVSR